MVSIPEGGLKPLKEWICDHCHQLIERPEDGWVEWLHDDKTGAHSFRIVHHASASPRGDGRCYRYSDHRDRQDNHLTQYIGPDGMGYALDWLSDGPADRKDGPHPANVRNINEFLDVFCRLHIAGYEEARFYFSDEERENGELPVHTRMLPSVLKVFIKSHRKKDGED
jgi:hypothetical protein